MKRRTPSAALYRPRTAVDLLALPLLGRLLRWRYGRLPLQLFWVIIAALLILDGFTGPQIASRNLATVAPWVHYRGLIILALLLLGNLFCMGCPFTLPRTLAKRLSLRGRRFPRLLRNKWLAILSLFGLFFLYEWLDLWASPALTAWVILAYFVASFVLEALFTESAFCKYFCPLGTFNFVYSSASPSQIAVKDAQVCAHCAGKECINGSYSAQPVIRMDQIPLGDGVQARQVQQGPRGVLGCGTLLYPPQLSSNMDCTLCLDCVRACPHDNIGWFLRTPGRELLHPQAMPARWDISLLLIALAFMGVVNAFGMVPPVYELLRSLAQWLGVTADFVPLLIVFGGGSLLLPALSAVTAAALGQLLTGTRRAISLRHTVAAFAPAFVPLGFGIWAAHYAFHFLIAPFSLLPVLQEFFGQTGDWARFGVGLPTDVIGFLQVLALLGGFLFALLLAQRAALRLYRRQAFIGLMPWALLLLLLMLAALAIFGQPMEMRAGDILFD